MTFHQFEEQRLILPLPVLSAESLPYCEVPESHRIREKKIFMILPNNQTAVRSVTRKDR